jgi:glycerate-2-kinase
MARTVLSDVLGDELSAIASGPTVADATTFSDAIKVFTDKQLWDKVPVAVQNHLQQGEQGAVSETAKAGSMPLVSKAWAYCSKSFATSFASPSN